MSAKEWIPSSVGDVEINISIVERLATAGKFSIFFAANDVPTKLVEQKVVLSQAGIFSIDALQIATADEVQSIESEKTRSIWIAGFGAAGPVVASGVILLMFEVTIALFIGLGSIFVLFLISEKTSQMFWRWLWYGVGIVFSMGVLALMSGIVLKVIAAVGLSFWVPAGIGAATGNNLTQGMNTHALQQGGVGLLMTLLLISVPPITANFFQGSVGNFMHFSAFGQGRPGANPGESGYRPAAPPKNQDRSDGDSRGGGIGGSGQGLTGWQAGGAVAAHEQRHGARGVAHNTQGNQPA